MGFCGLFALWDVYIVLVIIIEVLGFFCFGSVLFLFCARCVCVGGGGGREDHEWDAKQHISLTFFFTSMLLLYSGTVLCLL